MSEKPEHDGCSVCGRKDVGLKQDGTLRHHVHVADKGSGFLRPGGSRCEGVGKPPLSRQYGVRYKPDGPVFAYGSREEAEVGIEEHGYGVLVCQDHVKGNPSSGGGWQLADYSKES